MKMKYQTHCVDCERPLSEHRRVTRIDDDPESPSVSIEWECPTEDWVNYYNSTGPDE